MLSAPVADHAWKAMTRAFPGHERSEQSSTDAGTAAYAVLLDGPQTAGEAGPRCEPWLLLRARTAGRRAGH